MKMAHYPLFGCVALRHGGGLISASVKQLFERRIIREMSFAATSWRFLKNNKKYWLLPLLITLGLCGVLIIIAKSSSMTPFLYPLF